KGASIRRENQVAVPRQNTYMVGVLVEWMLPASLADDAKQNLLTWVHVRIAIVRLVRILRGVIRVHVVRHRTSIDHEVRRMVRLSWNVEAASRCSGNTCG